MSSNEKLFALIIAGIAVAVVVMALYNASNMNKMWTNPDPTPEQIILHKCNNLQQYYGEVGIDVNVRCDRLVHALTD